MLSNKTITRQKLHDLGLTPHQARSVTQSLEPITIDEGVYIYSLNEVISSIRHRLTLAGLRSTSQSVLEKVLQDLLKELDNVIFGPFGLSREEQISFYVQKILNFPHR